MSVGVWVRQGFGPGDAWPTEERGEGGKWEGGSGSSKDSVTSSRATFEKATGPDGITTLDHWQLEMHPPAGTDEKMAAIVDKFGTPNDETIYRGDGIVGQTPDQVAASLRGEDVTMGVSSFSSDAGQAAKFGTWDAPDPTKDTTVLYKVAAGDAEKSLPISGLVKNETTPGYFSAEREVVVGAQSYSVTDVTTGTVKPYGDAFPAVFATLVPK